MAEDATESSSRRCRECLDLRSAGLPTRLAGLYFETGRVGERHCQFDFGHLSRCHSENHASANPDFPVCRPPCEARRRVRAHGLQRRLTLSPVGRRALTRRFDINLMISAKNTGVAKLVKAE